MRRLVVVSSVAALLAFGAPVHAAVITFNNVTAMWSDGNPAANVTYVNNGTQAPSANWGVGTPQSGYDFVGAAPPAINVNVPPSPSALFTLGTFTHRNQPIQANTSITDIRLTVNMQVFVDGADQGFKNFVFDFDHWETPNGDNPCADGGAHGVGVNVAGCADRVTFNYNQLSDSFSVGGIEYTLDLAGFVLVLGGPAVSEFWTAEQANSSALLQGVVRERVIPEPALLWLVGLGLVGITSRLRSRR